MHLRPVTECPGIADKTAEKLEGGGIDNVTALAATNPMTIHHLTGCTLPSATKWNRWAREALQKSGFLKASTTTAYELLKRQKAALKISLDCKELDEFLGGGLEGGTTTQFYGQDGAGKSILCGIAAIQAQLPVKEGGAGKRALYIESEGSFRARRIETICTERDLDVERFLTGIEVLSPSNMKELTLHVEQLQGRVGRDNIGIIILDSISSLMRLETSGRGDFSYRAEHSNRILGMLRSIARTYSVPVIITSQITTDMDAQFGDDQKAYGGTALAHAATYTIKIHKPKGAKTKRLFRMVDSPEDAQIEVILHVTARGYEHQGDRR